MPPLPLLVFVVGTGSLGAEIAAVRLLAPYFGASTIVWANTIGIVLVALSIGYWLGGKWADKRPEKEPLCLLALVAAVLLAIVPFVADPMLDLAVDALDSISAGAFFGSLIGVLVLVAIPVLLLGAVTPWALRLAVADSGVSDAGKTAGRLYALSTAGSLLGTLLSALVLIPVLGTRRTFLVFALAIAVVAVPGLRLRRWAAAPAAIVVLILLPVGTLKAQVSDGKVIYETETETQYARVIERTDGSRALELNEGQAQHSIWYPDTTLTGDVWDGHLVLPWAVRADAPRRVAILGNAAGTTARAYEEFFPDTRVDGVEIDPELSEIGKKYFEMDNPQLRLYHEDARPFLRRMGDVRYDVISVDAYRQPYIPFYLATREFFELCRERLAPGGVLIVNAGHPADQDDLEKVLTATMEKEFAHVARDPIEDTNTLIVASEEPIETQKLATAPLPFGLRATADAAAARLDAPLEGGRVYTDDLAPVEWLIDKSIVDYAQGGED
ncbi:MAG: fused MFS/spermidine synthase [Thermoleophilaceae bacterium]|nr:fused MFS/spermidine synthase [Thermoleophilaceae bacterium]